ncbi:DNA-binding protein YbiB, partial [Klebsiella michiganensis]
CMVGSEPLPSSLKIQLACCLLATGVVLSLEQGLAKVAESW